MRFREPAARPCGTCPYRLDVPSGVWAREEYEKLPAYDNPTASQPFGAFGCHQADGRLCAGWVAVHDMHESLGLRIAYGQGMIPDRVMERVFDYETDVPLFASGREACEHGLRDIDTPSPKADRAVRKILRKRGHDT